MPTVHVNDYDFNDHPTVEGKAVYNLSLKQWLQLKLLDSVKVRVEQKKGWSGKNPFYIFKCKKCGEYGLDYPHNYSERLDCPVCCNFKKSYDDAIKIEIENRLEATIDG